MLAAVGLVASAAIVTASYQSGGEGDGDLYQDSQAGADVRDGPELSLSAEQALELDVPRDRSSAADSVRPDLSEADIYALEEAIALEAEALAIRYTVWLNDSRLAQWEVDSLYAQQLADAAARERAARARPVRGGSPDAYCTADFFRPYFGGAASAAAAVCRCESDYPSDTGAAGEKGLMQMMSFHQWRANLYGGNLYDPHINAAAAAHLWREQGWSPWTCARTLGLV